MFRHPLVVLGCSCLVLLTILAGTDAAGGLQSCTESDCVQPYVFYDTQNNCVEEIHDKTGSCYWPSGLDMRLDEMYYGGRIIAYQIYWFTAGWSIWFVPGFNDLDHKFNPGSDPSCPIPIPAYGLRRVWSYFQDHTHKIIICRS